jgi:hypothetical protein
VIPPTSTQLIIIATGVGGGAGGAAGATGTPGASGDALFVFVSPLGVIVPGGTTSAGGVALVVFVSTVGVIVPGVSPGGGGVGVTVFCSGFSSALVTVSVVVADIVPMVAVISPTSRQTGAIYRRHSGIRTGPVSTSGDIVYTASIVTHGVKLLCLP